MLRCAPQGLRGGLPRMKQASASSSSNSATCILDWSFWRPSVDTRPPLVVALGTADVPVAVVNPRQVRDFA